MSTELGALWTLLGLAGIAGVFFLLQRLRVRQRTLVVETTQFWRQATEETRARVLVQRFRHPWVYALLLGAASLLWLAFAGLDSRASERRESLVLIDASAGMAHGARFDDTLSAVDELLATLPARSRTVVLCGGRPRTLLRPGEHAQLFRDRLGDAGPEACPESLRPAIRTWLAQARTRPLDIYVAGDAWLTESFLAQMPDDVTLQRLAGMREQAPGRRGITQIGVASSEEWDQVDVLIEVAAAGGPSADRPSVVLEDAPLGIAPVAVSLPSPENGSRRRFLYRGLPARGQLLRATLPESAEDAVAFDDEALIVLPSRERLRIAMEPGLPDVLTRVIESDPALEVTSDAPEVVVRAAGSDYGGEAPALELGDVVQGHAFFVTCGADADPSEVILELHERLGLGEIDAMDLARATGRVISMGGSRGESRRLAVWERLFSSDYNFVSSRAYPLFVALGLRWLSGRSESPASLPAGEPTRLNGLTVRTSDDKSLNTLGDAFVPATAGLLATEEGPQLAASLLDPALSGAAATGAALPEAELSGSGVDWVTWLLLGALALLLVDWALFQRGRIP